MRTRTKARQRAVEALYEANFRSVPVLEIFDRNPATNEYACVIAQLAQENADRIDEVLNTYSQGWSVQRMPAVDKAIMQIAVAELLYQPEVETAIIISEAIEIAGILSAAESGKFINGILGQVAQIRTSISEL